MNTTLRAGQTVDSGFEILEVVPLDELNATGIWARHQKSGAQVFHVLNDDRENLFAFAFATFPKDSTGVAHILEHSVLCGSEHYPLKDAFLVLAQGSLQTYLNASTFPDKTIYPASSVHERDYFNLMAVYGDAVFRPLLSEWTFMQEGHRLVFTPDDASGAKRLGITGVVYNEMKGAYSSLDAYAENWATKSVLPDTIYAWESGGDPDRIPDLTWQGLLESHRAWYSPANCRIFLAGNIPTEQQLAFLNEQFLSRLPSGKALSPLTTARHWDSPRQFHIPCPAGTEKKSMVFLSWRCGDTTDYPESMALAALSMVLLGHDGSPLMRALIESGLGEDLAPCTGLEAEIRELVFTAGLRGVAGGSEAESAVEKLIMDSLRRLADEGIAPEEIEAALLSMEFSNREIRRSGGPFSLVWMRRALRGWLHGAKPWDSLLFLPAFTGLKRRLAAEPRFFEQLIQKYLLDNPHRALVTLEPQANFLEKKEAALAEALTSREAAFSEAERRNIEEKSAALAEIQEARDSADALAVIPHLSRRDLSREIDRIPRNVHDAAGIPVLTHEIHTNGITYGEFAFPVDTLTPEDYRWLPLFSRTVVSMGLPGMDYAEVSSLLARIAGGFYSAFQTGSCLSGASPYPVGRDWIVYRLKALDEKHTAALDLALRMILEADFQDERRLRDLVLEMKNDMDSSLAPAGHNYASSRAGRHFSRARTVEELWNGLDQLCFVHEIAEYDIAEISRKLQNLRDRITAGGLIANITGSAAAIRTAVSDIGASWSRFGPPRPQNPACADAGVFLEMTGGVTGGVTEPAPEVFAAPSLQIGFAAMSLPAALYPSTGHVAETILAHQLTTGALWERIRMQGGAYGAFAFADGIEKIFAFLTYRDPNPLDSLSVFGAILDDLTKQTVCAETADALEKAIIGCYARETRPRTPSERGFIDFCRCLSGVEDAHREAKLRGLIDVAEAELTQAAHRLAASMPAPVPVIIAGPAAAEEAAAKLGTAVRELPV